MKLNKRIEDLLEIPEVEEEKSGEEYKPESCKPEPYKLEFDDIYGYVDMYGYPRDKSGMY